MEYVVASSSKNGASKIALRMDDVGASTKKYEIYSKRRLVIRGREVFNGNWLFFKYLPFFRAWGPYKELNTFDWKQILQLLEKRGAKLTVAVTATWVTSEGILVPFPQKYPNVAAVIKEGVEQGLIEIANHGLTHCIVAKNQFRPKLLRGNRQFHREFTDLLSPKEHFVHIQRANEILTKYFHEDIVTLVPPGNKFTEDTLIAAAKLGIRYVSCNTSPATAYGLKLLGNESTFVFHDRDIVKKGITWFDRLLQNVSGLEKVFVKDLGVNLIPESASGDLH